MKLFVVAVGHRMPAWVDAGFTEYASRMPREMRVELIAPIAMEEGLRFAIREGGRTVGAGRVTKILT